MWRSARRTTAGRQLFVSVQLERPKWFRRLLIFLLLPWNVLVKLVNFQHVLIALHHLLLFQLPRPWPIRNQHVERLEEESGRSGLGLTDPLDSRAATSRREKRTCQRDRRRAIRYIVHALSRFTNKLQVGREKENTVVFRSWILEVINDESKNEARDEQVN